MFLISIISLTIDRIDQKEGKLWKFGSQGLVIQKTAVMSVLEQAYIM